MTGYWYQRITKDAFENAASRFARNYAIKLMLHNLRFRLLAELDQRSIDQLLYVHTVQLLTGHCIHTVHCTAQFSYTWISCLQKKLCSNQLWTTLFHRPFRNPMWLKEKHRFVRCWVNALRCSIVSIWWLSSICWVIEQGRSPWSIFIIIIDNSYPGVPLLTIKWVFSLGPLQSGYISLCC